jgi:predicted nucleotidyltransferase
MERAPRIAFDRESLAALCRRWHIKRLALFGSVMRDDVGPDSDVDVLYEFEEGTTPERRMVDLMDELSALFGGREIDLVSFNYINPWRRKYIMEDMQMQYDAA